ncbi:PKD domain-containing protein, partial [Gaetbulibacter sp. M240]|uniref:PKD domain-containing protein n=1 Tax=Gaetbulibacter sp. M240 TaxID=3126511 RepID=UPI00374E9AB2
MGKHYISNVLHSFSLSKLFILFFFLGILKANADCTIGTAETGGDNVMTGQELLTYINNNSCSGTLTIESPVDIILNQSLEIPNSIDRIIIKDGGQILWAANSVDLILAPSSAIVIENTSSIGSQTGALGSTTTTCSNNRRLLIGTIEYSACSGGGNVCITFADLIKAGGTPSLDPNFAVVSGSDNSVCFGPTFIDIALDGLVSGGVSYQWSESPFNTGTGTITFSPDNTQDTTIEVSEPGLYTVRITVTISLGIDGSTCGEETVDVFTDIEINFLDSISVNTFFLTPSTSGNGTCGLSVDFTGSADNAGGSPSYLWDFGDGNNSTEMNPTHTYSQSGTYTVTLTVTNNDPDALAECSSASNSQDITLTDEPPTITCPDDITVNVDPGLCSASNLDLGNLLLSDDCDIINANISNNAPSIFPVGSTTVTWSYTDASNNTVTCDQLVTVNDDEHPEFTAPANITLECDQDPTDLSITGNPNIIGDNCDPNPVATYTDATTPGICANSYTITRTWRVTDATGNFHEHDQIIFVEDTTLPTATAPADVTVECIEDVSAVDILAITDEADNCTANPIVTHISD